LPSNWTTIYQKLTEVHTQYIKTNNSTLHFGMKVQGVQQRSPKEKPQKSICTEPNPVPPADMVARRLWAVDILLLPLMHIIMYMNGMDDVRERFF